MKTSDNPLKKPSSFLSDMFKGFSLFIFVALFSFFGAIELLSPSTVTQMEENQSSAEEGYSFASFAMSLLELENIDTNFSLAFTGANVALGNVTAQEEGEKLSLADMEISLNGHVVYAEGGVYVDLAIVYNGQEIALEVGFLDNNLYVITDGVTYAFDLTAYSSSLTAESQQDSDEPTSALEVEEGQEGQEEELNQTEESEEEGEDSSLDYSAILNYVCDLLGIDLDESINQICQFLEIDLETFSLNDFLTDIMSTPAVETEDGCKFTISIGSRLSFLITCDKNYNIKSIKSNDVLVAYNSFKFTANVNAMNNVDMTTFEPTIVELPFDPADNATVDLSGVAIYTAYAQNMIGSFDVILADVAVDVDGEEIIANVAFDGTYVAVSAEIGDVEIVVTASGSVAFVQVGELKVKFAYKDYSAVKASVLALLQTEMASPVLEQIEAFLDEVMAQLEESKVEEISVEELLFSVIDLATDSKVLSMLPTSATLVDGTYTLVLGNSVTLVLNSEDKILTSLTVSTASVTASADFSEGTSKIEIVESEYADIADISSLVDLATDILTAKGFAGTIEYGTYTFGYEVDLEKLTLKVTGEILGLEFAVYLTQTDNLGTLDSWKVVLELVDESTTNPENVYFSATLAELEEVISDAQAWISKYFTTETVATAQQQEEGEEGQTLTKTQEAMQAVEAVLKVVGQIRLSISSTTKENVTTESFDISYLGADVSISLTNGVATILGEYSSIEVILTVEAKAPAISVPTATATNLTAVADLIFADSYKFAFTAEYNNESTYAGLKVSGSVIVSSGMIEIVLFSTLSEEDGGSDLVIQIADGTCKILYGVLAYSIDLTSTSTGTAGAVSTASLSTILSELLANNEIYGVKFNFGEFEEILQIISTYSAQNYLDNLILGLSVEDGAIVLDVDLNNTSVSKALDLGTLTLDFASNTFTASALNLLNISLTSDSTLVMREIDVADEDFVDLNELCEQISYAIELLGAYDILEAEVEATYDGVTFTANVAYDGSFVRVSSEIGDVEIVVTASESVAFVQVGELKVKFAYKDYSAVKASVLALLQTEMASPVLEQIEAFLDEVMAQLEENKVEEISVEELLFSVIDLATDSNVLSMLPTSATLVEGTYTLVLGDSVTFVLNSEDKILTSVQVFCDSVTASASFAEGTSKIEIVESEYADIADISLLVDLATDILTAKGFAGTIEYGTYTFGYEVDLENLTLKVTGEILGLEFAVYLTQTDNLGTLDSWKVVLELVDESTTNPENVYFSATLAELEEVISDAQAWISKYFTTEEVVTSQEEGEEGQTLTKTQEAMQAVEAVLKVVGQIQLSISSTTKENVTTESFDISCLGADVSISLTNGVATILGEYSSIEVILTVEAKAPAISVPTATATNLTAVADLIFADSYKFAFTAEYNNESTYAGLKVSGSVIVSSGMIEIVLFSTLSEEDGGSDLVIQIADGTCKILYGDLAYSIDLTSTSTGTASTTSLTTILSNLLSDNDVYGVHFEFGEFEEILQIISTYSAQDYLDNLILSLSVENGAIVLDVDLNNTSVSKALDLGTLTLDFASNTFTASALSLLNISLTSDSTLKFRDVSSTTEDLVESLLGTFQTEENVYAFSSNIDIRYSTTTFSGVITALLEVGTDAQTGQTTLTPTISVYTSAMSLSTYIYMVDNTIYIDINGLQISADLSTTTINEVLDFLDEYFGISLLSSDSSNSADVSSALDALSIALPQIDLIYLSWCSVAGGLQLNMASPDKLYYTASAYFTDIVLQVVANYATASEGEDGSLILTSLGGLVPTEIVFGANISDANTTTHNADYYSGSLLTCETALTSSLNFAIYLQGVEVGSSANTSMFGYDNNGTLTTVASNSGTTKLSDFTDISTLIELVENVLKYVYGYQYQVSLSASITTTDENSNSSTTSISGDVIAMLEENTNSTTSMNEAETLSELMSAFSQFKLQAGLTIATSSSTHQVDLLYEDDDSNTNSDDGLYLTYAHGSYIGSSAFKGYIEEAGMSDIVSMILAFAGIDLGEDLSEMLELSECDTNFTFLQSLLGIGEQDISDDTAKIDNILQSVESMLKLLNSITISTDASGNTVLTVKLDLSTFSDATSGTNICTITIVVGEAPVSLTIENLVYGSMCIDSVILTFETYDSSNFDYDKTASHFNLSSMADFLDATVETLNTQNLNFKGSAVVAIGSNDAINIGVDMYANISDDGDVYLYAELDIEAVYAVTYTLFSQKYTTTNFSKGSRYSVLEYYDGVLYLTRTTVTNSNGTDFLEKAWTFGTSTDANGNQTTLIMDEDGNTTDIMEMMAYILGLGTLVYDVMGSITFNINFTLEEAIKSFAATTSGYSMTLDGESLLDSSSFGDIAVDIGVASTDSEGKKYVGSGSDTKEYTFLDSVALSMKIASIISVSVDLESVYTSNDAYSDSNSTTIESYKTNAGKTLYTNDYYRKAYAKHLTSISLNTSGGNNEATVYASAGGSVTLPTPTRNADDDGSTHTEYAFDGWYTDEDLTIAFECTDNGDGTYSGTMPQTATTLYAKWTPTTYSYHTTTFNTGSSGIEMTSVSTWETNSVTITAPENWSKEVTNADGSITTFTYAFDGWFTDAELTTALDCTDNGDGTYTFIMPSSDLTLYVGWKVADESTVYPVYVYDGNTLATTLYFAEGEAVDLSTYDGFNSNSILFTSNSYAEADIVKSVTMQTSSISLYIGYSVVYAYEFLDENGNTQSETVTVYYYMGQEVTLLTLSTWLIDVDEDDDGTADYNLEYSFQNWLDTSNKAVTSLTMASANVDLHVSLDDWNVEKTLYQILRTLSIHDGIATATMSIVAGTTVDLAETYANGNTDMIFFSSSTLEEGNIIESVSIETADVDVYVGFALTYSYSYTDESGESQTFKQTEYHYAGEEVTLLSVSLEWSEDVDSDGDNTADYHAEYAFKAWADEGENEVSSLTMDSNSENLHAVWTETDYAYHTVTYTYSYVDSNSTTQSVSTTNRFYEGQTVTLPTISLAWEQDVDSNNDGELDYRAYYTQTSTWALDGTTITTLAMGTSDITLVAVWTPSSTVNYYTVSFNVTFVNPSGWNDNNNSFTGKITCNSSPTAVASVRVLSGTLLDLTQFNSTCNYSYKAVGISDDYDFKVVTWNTSAPSTVAYITGNKSYTVLESITITANTTMYATWGFA